MSEQEPNKSNARVFIEGVFKAEEESAASLGTHKLNKYADIAIRMFHTGVLTPKEMLLPSIGQFATKMLTGLQVYKTMYYVDVL
ncbi:MAG: hypothetical protein II621_01270 [Clostridia bacterium]|nr:hypothetical protein [Clostridia bacterium]